MNFMGKPYSTGLLTCVEDPYEAIEELIRLGTDRILHQRA